MGTTESEINHIVHTQIRERRGPPDPRETRPVYSVLCVVCGLWSVCSKKLLEPTSWPRLAASALNYQRWY